MHRNQRDFLKKKRKEGIGKQVKPLFIQTWICFTMGLLIDRSVSAKYDLLSQ